MTEPNSEPEVLGFYSARAKFETRPEDDPPMTVRVESWERRYDPTARRVIKEGDEAGEGFYPWRLVTGRPMKRGVYELHDDEVRGWPVSHPVEYTTAFRHESTRAGAQRAQESVQAGLVGDMGEEAFRG